MEELKALGFELTFSGPSYLIPRWGKYIIHAKHSAGGTVNGYGDDEAAAIADAVATVQKRLAYVEPSTKVTH
jgi:hypothetical protein